MNARLLVSLAMSLCAAPTMMIGCSSQPHASHKSAASLRPIVAPAGGTLADSQRAMLARFVGIWEMQGWSVDAGGARNTVSGRAAATIEREHFVLVDLQATDGQMAGRSLKRGGSILLASEPGLGVTMTTWGDAAPSVGRLVGTPGEGGGYFRFEEAQTPPDQRRVVISIEFVSDDQWTVEIRNADDEAAGPVAAYQFKRAAN